MVVSANPPWTISEKIAVEDLSAGKWVLREDGSGTRAAFVEALDVLGVPYGKLAAAIELPSNEAVLAAVFAGAGAAILSALVRRRNQGRYPEALPVFIAPWAFYCVRHGDHYRSRAVSALREILRAHAVSYLTRR